MADVTQFNLNIYLFATLKDLAGTNQVSITLPSTATINDVRQQLAEQYPKLAAALPSAIAAVNHEFVFSGHPITDTDEVAFFPPVSGGSDAPSFPEIFLVASESIDLNELTARIVIPATGAVALFSGYVRGETQRDNGKIHTTHLEYEAYEPMAITKMKQVAAEIREQWPMVQGIAIVQRIGHLKVSEPTVLIACSSGHRDQGCFEAARYGIDRLKEIVPVWKKEVSPNGQHWVEGSYHPQPDDIETPQ
jgi:molybdopterin synthase catalytic subunit